MWSDGQLFQVENEHELYIAKFWKGAAETISQFLTFKYIAS